MIIVIGTKQTAIPIIPIAVLIAVFSWFMILPTRKMGLCFVGRKFFSFSYKIL
jgi:hypothetical protein